MQGAFSFLTDDAFAAVIEKELFRLPQSDEVVLWPIFGAMRTVLQPATIRARVASVPSQTFASHFREAPSKCLRHEEHEQLHDPRVAFGHRRLSRGLVANGGQASVTQH